MSGKHGPHHLGPYPRQAVDIRAKANADPTTRCWQCHLTLAEAQTTYGPKTMWTAGHLNDGQINGPLAAECSHCNYSRGASNANRRRIGLDSSQNW